MWRNHSEADGDVNASPPARSGHACAFMGGSQVMLLFGTDGKTRLDDAWILDASDFTWRLLQTTCRDGSMPPPPRSGQSATIWRDHLVIFGGQGGWNGAIDKLDDLYLLSIPSGEWWQPEVRGNSPSARYRHSTAIDHDLLVMFGGETSPMHQLQDSWVLQWTPEHDDLIAEWVSVPAHAPPSVRARHSASFVGGSMFVIGGHTKGTSLNDVHMLGCSPDTTAWSWALLEVSGQPPAACDGHTATVVGSSIITIGGTFKRDKFTNDSWLLDTETAQWSALQPSGEVPSPRAFHSTVLCGRQLVVFGGADKWSALADLHTIDVPDHVAPTVGVQHSGALALSGLVTQLEAEVKAFRTAGQPRVEEALHCLAASLRAAGDTAQIEPTLPPPPDTSAVDSSFDRLMAVVASLQGAGVAADVMERVGERNALVSELRETLGSIRIGLQASLQTADEQATSLATSMHSLATAQDQVPLREAHLPAPRLQTMVSTEALDFQTVVQRFEDWQRKEREHLGYLEARTATVLADLKQSVAQETAAWVAYRSEMGSHTLHLCAAGSCLQQLHTEQAATFQGQRAVLAEVEGHLRGQQQVVDQLADQAQSLSTLDKDLKDLRIAEREQRRMLIRLRALHEEQELDGEDTTVVEGDIKAAQASVEKLQASLRTMEENAAQMAITGFPEALLQQPSEESPAKRNEHGKTLEDSIREKQKELIWLEARRKELELETKDDLPSLL